MADDDELLDLMRDAGCSQILIGLESPQSPVLDGLEQRRNWKYGRSERYLEAIDNIQKRGITVNGCFVLGLDGADATAFDAVEAFVEASNLYEVQITIMTPFPGTPLYARLLEEGRILEPGAWEKCTLFDVNYTPSHMTVQELEAGFADLTARLYTGEAVKRRQQRFFQRRYEERERNEAQVG